MSAGAGLLGFIVGCVRVSGSVGGTNNILSFDAIGSHILYVPPGHQACMVSGDRQQGECTHEEVHWNGRPA
jgi:hypothetical protein